MKLAIVGAENKILPFKALGVDVFTADEKGDVLNSLNEIVKSEMYAIAFLTESSAKVLGEDIDKFMKYPVPSFVILPSFTSLEEGMGMLKMKRAIEKAVGSQLNI